MRKEYNAWRHVLTKADADLLDRPPEWDSFDAFLSDVGPAPSARHHLRRVDPSGDFMPENLRWSEPPAKRPTQRELDARAVLQQEADYRARSISHAPITEQVRRDALALLERAAAEVRSVLYGGEALRWPVEERAVALAFGFYDGRGCVVWPRREKASLLPTVDAWAAAHGVSLRWCWGDGWRMTRVS